jgi:hypothetical protein
MGKKVMDKIIQLNPGESIESVLKDIKGRKTSCKFTLKSVNEPRTPSIDDLSNSETKLFVRHGSRVINNPDELKAVIKQKLIREKSKE